MDNPNYYLNIEEITKRWKEILACKKIAMNPEFQKYLDKEPELCLEEMQEAYMYKWNPTLYRLTKNMDGLRKKKPKKS